MRTIGFVVLLLILIVFRLPFLPQFLVGEEGVFAALVAMPQPSSVSTSNHLPQMLSAVVNGEPGYDHFQHNIVPYQILEKSVGSLIRRFDVASWSPEKTTVIVRASYFSLFLIGILGLVWRASASVFRSALAVFFLSTPLAVGASVQPQVDGSTGVLLLGLGSFLLSMRVTGAWRVVASLAAGLLIGLARHEDAIAVLAAALGVAGLMLVVRKGKFEEVLPAALGVVLGIALSIAMSPEEYLAGFDTMGRVYVAGSHQRWDVLSAHVRFVWPVLLLMTMSLAVFVYRYDALLVEIPRSLVICFGGVAIACGFAMSGWGGDGFPRYYAPALVALTFAIIEFDRAEALLKSSVVRHAVIMAFAAGTGWNAVTLAGKLRDQVSITSYPDFSLPELRASMEKSAERSTTKHVIVLEHSGLWLHYPKTEFMARDWGLEGARQYLQEAYPQDASRFDRGP